MRKKEIGLKSSVLNFCFKMMVLFSKAVADSSKKLSKAEQ